MTSAATALTRPPPLHQPLVNVVLMCHLKHEQSRNWSFSNQCDAAVHFTQTKHETTGIFSVQFYIVWPQGGYKQLTWHRKKFHSVKWEIYLLNGKIKLHHICIISTLQRTQSDFIRKISRWVLYKMNRLFWENDAEHVNTLCVNTGNSF